MAEERDHYILRRIKEDRKEAEHKRKIAEKKNEDKILKEALDIQVGGTHYKNCKIQPVEYIYANNLTFLEGNVIKYITRHKTKGDGEADIRKVIHYAQMILQMEYSKGD
mgnify:CR=1 FL=1